MHHKYRKSGEQVDQKIPVGHSVERISANVFEVKLFGLKKSVRIVRGSGERAAADGRNISFCLAVNDTRLIAQKHHRVRHKIVTEGDGLSALKMRISRHDSSLVFFRLFRYRRYKIYYLFFYYIAGGFRPHTYIERDLVVSAPRGMQFFARLAYTFRQYLFDEHMYILAVGIGQKSAVQHIVEYQGQAVCNFVRLVFRHDALVSEHLRVRDTARNILFEHTAVKAYGRIEIVRQLVCRTVRASRPHFTHFLTSFICFCCLPAPGPLSEDRKGL